MDRGAWWSTLHGDKRVEHDWATKQPQQRAKMPSFVTTSILISRNKIVSRNKGNVNIRSDWSDQISRSVVSDSLRPHESQHTRPPCPSPIPGVYSNSCPSSRWCHPAISSSVIPFSSRLEFFPHQGLFKWVSSSHQVAKILDFQPQSVLPMTIQDWFPLGWTGWIFLQSKGLSRVFSNNTVQKHQFFGARSHIHMWLLEKT